MLLRKGMLDVGEKGADCTDSVVDTNLRENKIKFHAPGNSVWQKDGALPP